MDHLSPPLAEGQENSTGPKHQAIHAHFILVIGSLLQVRQKGQFEMVRMQYQELNKAEETVVAAEGIA